MGMDLYGSMKPQKREKTPPVTDCMIVAVSSFGERTVRKCVNASVAPFSKKKQRN